MSKKAFKRAQEMARRENEGVERECERIEELLNEERKQQMKNEKRETKKTGMVAGVYLRAKRGAGLELNFENRIIGLDDAKSPHVTLKLQAPASEKEYARRPAFLIVRDYREHVVNAARAIKDPTDPTAEEMGKLVTDMSKVAFVQVHEDGPRGFVTINYPHPNRGSQGRFSVDYYDGEAPAAPENPDDLWWESRGEGTVRMCLVKFVRTGHTVPINATRPPKPEAKPADQQAAVSNQPTTGDDVPAQVVESTNETT